MRNITLKRDKETKNKIRFSNDPAEAISGSLYVSKELAGSLAEIKLAITTPEPSAPVADIT
jgi:hypothetical protein